MVVRLGAANARWGYATIGALAYLWPLAMVAHRTPAGGDARLAGSPRSRRWRRRAVLWGAADRPKALAPALPLTIVAASAHGLLMAATLAPIG